MLHQGLYLVYDISEDAYWLISADAKRKYLIRDVAAMDTLLHEKPHEIHSDAVKPIDPKMTQKIKDYCA